MNRRLALMAVSLACGVAAVTGQEPAQEDVVQRLTRQVEALTREVAALRADVARERIENLRLRAELDRGCGIAPRAAAPAPTREPELITPAAPAGTRFRDRGDYVEDTKTGLLWQKDGAASGKRNYYDAQTYAAGLTLGGLKGWRVPTRAELAAIFPATEAPFTNTKYTPVPCCKGPFEWNSYWTADVDPRLPDYAYVYQWYDKGGANNGFASRNFVYVRAVHDPVRK